MAEMASAKATACGGASMRLAVASYSFLSIVMSKHHMSSTVGDDSVNMVACQPS